MLRSLKEPEKHDPVYGVCEELFSKIGPLSLLRTDDARREVREKAERRYMQGYPPRKKMTSYGDSLNWEWMATCAVREKADLIIVSRDSDYGVMIENTGYINDHLKQEFRERVGDDKKLILYSLLTRALQREFGLQLTQKEVAAERKRYRAMTEFGGKTLAEYNRFVQEALAEALRDARVRGKAEGLVIPAEGAPDSEDAGL
jgi:hypothetical protein